jgi:hypothetical protein
MFCYMDGVVEVREDSVSAARIKTIDRMRFAKLVNDHAEWEEARGDGGARRGVPAAPEVINYLYAREPSIYRPLRGVITSPAFSKDGDLIDQRGYHESSAPYLAPNHGLIVPPVSAVPSWDEVLRAKRLLIEETFADFPLGGLKRHEIMEACFGEGTPGVPAVANPMAVTLLPFMRELVDGPTPGHLFTKPTPGTGALRLSEALTTIAQGEPAESKPMPGNEDEVSKTLTTILRDADQFAFFDNINHGIDSGALASVMTARSDSARILGTSESIKTEVRCIWIRTGNNVSLSNELVRRLIMVDLDAKMANPKERTGWRHGELFQWIKRNRGDLVWAALTIIRNWIAKGRPDGTVKPLASYEEWSRTVGGVLGGRGHQGLYGEPSRSRGSSGERSQRCPPDRHGGVDRGGPAGDGRGRAGRRRVQASSAGRATDERRRRRPERWQGQP